MKTLKVTKEEIYKMLIRMHRYTIDQIADMNHWQQMVAADVEPKDGSDLVEFATMDQYLAWKAAK